MPAITYPATLPAPSVADVTAHERRLVAPLDGARVTRPAQLDRLALQELTFEFLGSANGADFYAWWRDTLVFGGAWFAATWPLPQGWVSGVRRFASVPQWRYSAGQGWRVTAQCEVRGAGLAPQSA